MTKRIMLACSAGMSTSLLVTKMQAAAKEQGVDADIYATAVSDADNKAAEERPDVLMLGPQVRYMLDDFKKHFDFPVTVIDMRDYGMMNGANVLKQGLETIEA